jgi:hypothetical protein
VHTADYTIIKLLILFIWYVLEDALSNNIILGKYLFLKLSDQDSYIQIWSSGTMLCSCNMILNIWNSFAFVNKECQDISTVKLGHANNRVIVCPR